MLVKSVKFLYNSLFLLKSLALGHKVEYIIVGSDDKVENGFLTKDMGSSKYFESYLVGSKLDKLNQVTIVQMAAVVYLRKNKKKGTETYLVLESKTCLYFRNKCRLSLSFTNNYNAMSNLNGKDHADRSLAAVNILISLGYTVKQFSKTAPDFINEMGDLKAFYFR